MAVHSKDEGVAEVVHCSSGLTVLLSMIAAESFICIECKLSLSKAQCKSYLIKLPESDILFRTSVPRTVFLLRFWASANSTKFTKLWVFLCQNDSFKLKMGSINKKKHLFHTFSQNLWSQFSKVLDQFCDIRPQRNTDVDSAYSMGNIFGYHLAFHSTNKTNKYLISLLLFFPPSSSWGPDDDGKTIDGPHPLAQVSFQQGSISHPQDTRTCQAWILHFPI